MKKTLTVLMMLLLAAMLIVSCDNATTEPNAETPTSFKVTFKLNGGTGTGYDEQTIEKGETVAEPATDPKKTNAVFSYWSKDKTNEFAFDTPITENTTLYAVWKTEFAVGDTGPSGGTVFYVANSEQRGTYVNEKGDTIEYTWKYLEAAPADLTITEGETAVSTFVFGYYFKDGAISLVGSTGDSVNAIGAGRANTRTLVNAMGGFVYTTDAVCSACSNSTEVSCAACNGNGAISEKACSNCNGTGSTTAYAICMNCYGRGCDKCNYKGNTGSTTTSCKTCNGSGSIYFVTPETCTDCQGKGKKECSACASSRTGNYAAKVCDDYTCNGYDDWFLPSDAELVTMKTKLFDQSKGGTWGSTSYWSSSEGNKSVSRYLDFSMGLAAGTYRNTSCGVRPCRAF